jgi:hypothetical protein
MNIRVSQCAFKTYNERGTHVVGALALGGAARLVEHVHRLLFGVARACDVEAAGGLLFQRHHSGSFLVIAAVPCRPRSCGRVVVIGSTLADRNGRTPGPPLLDEDARGRAGGCVFVVGHGHFF